MSIDARYCSFYERIYKRPNTAMHSSRRESRPSRDVNALDSMHSSVDRSSRSLYMSLAFSRSSETSRHRRSEHAYTNSYNTNSPMNSTIDDGDLVADGQRAIIEAS